MPAPWTKNPRKQDWSPRDIPVPRNRAVLLYQGQEWWDAMWVFRKKMKAWNFKQWLVLRCRAKSSRLWIYRQLRWSDGVRGDDLLGLKCNLYASELADAVIQRLEAE